MRKRNKEYDKKYTVEWRRKNPDRVRELGRKSYHKHREERITQRKERYKNDPEYREKHRARNREWLYGITQEEYKILNEVQNGLCAICNKPQQTRRSKNLYVDHNHQTNKIRGLLCQKCNSAIGLVDENINTLEKIIIYLKRHATQ